MLLFIIIVFLCIILGSWYLNLMRSLLLSKYLLVILLLFGVLYLIEMGVWVNIYIALLLFWLVRVIGAGGGRLVIISRSITIWLPDVACDRFFWSWRVQGLIWLRRDLWRPLTRFLALALLLLSLPLVYLLGVLRLLFLALNMFVLLLILGMLFMTLLDWSSWFMSFGLFFCSNVRSLRERRSYRADLLIIVVGSVLGGLILSLLVTLWLRCLWGLLLNLIIRLLSNLIRRALTHLSIHTLCQPFVKTTMHHGFFNQIIFCRVLRLLLPLFIFLPPWLFVFLWGATWLLILIITILRHFLFLDSVLVYLEVVRQGRGRTLNELVWLLDLGGRSTGEGWWLLGALEGMLLLVQTCDGTVVEGGVVLGGEVLESLTGGEVCLWNVVWFVGAASTLVGDIIVNLQGRSPATTSRVKVPPLMQTAPSPTLSSTLTSSSCIVTVISEVLNYTAGHHWTKWIGVSFYWGEATATWLAGDDVTRVVIVEVVVLEGCFFLKVIKKFDVGQLLESALVLNEVGSHFSLEFQVALQVEKGYISSLV